MNSPAPAAGPGPRERIILLTLAALLAGAVLWLRGGLQPLAPLEALARRSPDLSVALANGRPTIVEFYADWCEACRSMAPALDAVESRQHERLNVVLLNVDNPRWQPEIDRYDVNGIPHLELFDAGGIAVGRAIGARSRAELDSLAIALLENQPLPVLAGVGATSSLAEQPPGEASPAGSQAGPRSHG
ncbi:MAG: thioredoxin domain-containing protein [Cyanobium sp.]|jgi:thiol-disulfide isomerase/thioredoxin